MKTTDKYIITETSGKRKEWWKSKPFELFITFLVASLFDFMLLGVFLCY